MDGAIHALTKQQTQWKENMYFAVKLAQQKLSTYCAEVTPIQGILLICANIVNPWWTFRSFKKWDKGMDINSAEEISYTSQYHEAIVTVVENEYCAKHRLVPVNQPESVPSSNLLPSATALETSQSSLHLHDLSRNDQEYLVPTNVAEMTSRRSDHAVRWFTATGLYLNSPPGAPTNWGQINPNHHQYHSDPMEISSTFCILDITEWWRKHEETHSKYANLSNVAYGIFSIIPDYVTVDGSFSLGQDVIGWRQSITTALTLHAKVVRQFARANNGILAGSDPALNTTNTEYDSEIMNGAVERKLHRMAKVHNLWDNWQGSENLHTTKKESRAQNKQMTAIGYISDIEEIIKASWSLFQHDGAAALKLSEGSSLPPVLSPENLTGGWTQIWILHWIMRINCHSVKTHNDSTPKSISDTNNSLHWNGYLQNPNDSKDECAADIECHRWKDNGIEDPDCPELRDVSATPDVPRLIRQTWKSQRQAETVLMTIKAIEMWRNKGVKNMVDRMRQLFSSLFMYLDWVCQLEIYSGWMVSSSLRISVDKQIYSRCNECFAKIYKF